MCNAMCLQSNPLEHDGHRNARVPEARPAVQGVGRRDDVILRTHWCLAQRLGELVLSRVAEPSAGDSLALEILDGVLQRHAGMLRERIEVMA